MIGVAAGAQETVTGVGFAGKQYMQDVNKSVCDSVDIGTEGRLIDNRDNKIYWVAKLKDGLCWMTQNLALDLTNRTLLTTDSDVTNNWSSAAGDSALWTSSDGNAIKYYNPGIVGYEGDKRFILDNTAVETNDPDFVIASSYLSTDGKVMCNKTAGSFIGDLTSDYIACRVYYSNATHYLIGNYYSWAAATAGDTRVSGDSEQSICPKGWKLPTSNNDNIGSFSALTTNISTSNTLIAYPYYFIYGGEVLENSLRAIGSNGFYWSSTTFDAGNAYVLNIALNGISPLGLSNRYRGDSVRCVAR